MAGERQQNNRAILAGGALNQENEKNAEMANVCFGSRKLPKGLLWRNSLLRVGPSRWAARDLADRSALDSSRSD